MKAYRTNYIDYPPAVHDYIEFVYVENGGGTAFCEGKEYHLNKGDMFLVFPNQVHSYINFESSQNTSYYIILASPSHLRMDPSIFYKSVPLIAQRRTNDIILIALFEIAAQQFLFGKPAALQDIISAIFNIIIGYFTLTDRTAPDTTVQKILIYCNENFKDDISVEKMSKELYLSKSAIARIFSSVIQTNFRNHINSLRIECALQLMQDNHRTIAEAATMAGFNSIRTFNRAFLEKYGCTPSEHLALMKMSKNQLKMQKQQLAEL